MANAEHLAKLKEGVKAWNEWKTGNTTVVPDLRKLGLRKANLRGADLEGAYLTGASLSGASLFRADLSRADIGGADLRKANLGGADLRGSNLCGADIRDANLMRADLREADLAGANLSDTSLRAANLSGSDLRRANLSRAKLSGANFDQAKIGWTTFGNDDLSEIKALDTVQHLGPSTICIDTMYRSQGKIPLAFLRGAGVPDIFIDYLPSLTAMDAVQFYSCFISYSTKDEEFAERLHADLQNKGVRCWFAPHDIQAGKKIHEQIDEAIRRYERLLLILSPNSMNSEWVKTEIRKARKRERTEKKRVLFPVRLVSFEAIRDWELFTDEGKDLAVEIREYYIPDFSDWKNHDPYAEGLKNLLRDLKAEQTQAA